MPSKNSHVKNYIEHYSRLSVVPEYALLIKGAWGSGKSHLVNEVISNIENSTDPVKFLSVSLYGITNTEDIEAKFFQSLNPLLSSRGVVFATTLAKGILKGALKVDIDGDGKNDATMSVGIPDLKISKYLSDTKNCVLVFDDLERCAMPLKEILGYINHFVEKDGYKVIIIAEEEALSKKYDESKTDRVSSYNHIKEKLIGKTLEVVPDIDFVFDVFIDEVLQDVEVSDVLKRYKSDITSQFKSSGYNNLRSLRKFIMDFDRLYSVFDNKIKEKDTLIRNLIITLTIVSLEIYSGNISAIEISGLLNEFSILGLKEPSDDLELNKYRNIFKKYNNELNDTVFPADLWQEFFDKGIIEKNIINRAIKESRYFYTDTIPTWKKLWGLYNLTDDVFEIYYSDVKTKFDNYKYTNLGHLKHIGGIFLRLAKDKLLEGKTSTQVFNELKSYVDHIFKEKLAEVDNLTYDLLNDRHIGVEQLGWPDDSLPYYTDFSDYLNTKILKTQSDNLVSQADEVLDAMKTDFTKFNGLLTDNNYEQSRFQSKPVMQHVNIDKFMDIFINFNGADKDLVINILCRRYDSEFYHQKLKEDLPWLKKLINRLNVESDNRQGTLNGVMIKKLLPKLEKMINKMKVSLSKT